MILILVLFLVLFTLSLICMSDDVRNTVLSSGRRGKKHPPGPLPWPIIGNLHLLGKQPHQSLAKLAKTYGPLMSIKLGQVTTVVISSSNTAKLILKNHDVEFCGRSVPDAIHARDHSQYSVVWLPVGSRWRSLRRILNSYIFSANRLDANHGVRSRKVEELMDYCERSRQRGEAIDIGQAAFRTSLNLLSTILFSEDLTDPFTDSAKEMKNVIWDVMVEASRPNVVDFFPALKKIDPQGMRGRMSDHFGKIFDMFKGLISARLREESGGRDDVLDNLLTLGKESPEEMDRNLIEHVFLDLFVAGTDTTSNTLEWAMSEMIKNPSILKKVQSELAKTIGRGKQVEESDLTNLPYLQCIVKETLRLHPPVPLLIHKVESGAVGDQVEVFGYNVAVGSRALVNVWAIGRDEMIWGEDALVFKPERFGESQVDLRGQDFELIPFGAGRRICPGMSLVLRTLPLVLGSLLNMFDWKLEGDNKPEDLNMEEKFGITLQRAYPLRLIPTCS
ncbi:OLC1v1021992C1 [Oldenlandia corymbosa var. corymbosa]|uniref:OLC1v1021992C1 n=1 Tax=Oldenlandia corymbosa var. corymbosa TaxID=529605 RepID=A0AAV1BXH5_OLDCO|nr:OLC1v1021992C1 [Oldenlandia corymbosa var. corymbosa]